MDLQENVYTQVEKTDYPKPGTDTPRALVKKTLVKKPSPSNGAENASAEFVDFKKKREP